MNSPDLDEILSAYIDGLASGDETARIESDPVLLARADELRATARAVAQPVTPPEPAAVDAAIAKALGQSATAVNVTSLATHRQPRQRRVLVVAAAAAVVAFGFLAGAVLLAANDGDDAEDLAAELDQGDGSQGTDDSAAASSAEIPGEESASQESATTADGADGDTSRTESAETLDEAPQSPPAEAADDALAENDAALDSADETADSASEQPAAEDPAAEDPAAEESAAEESADLATEEAEEGAAPGGAAEPPELYVDVTALLAAIEDGSLEPEVAAPPLPCGLQIPQARSGSTYVVVEAALPAGPVVVTGWESPEGFEADGITLLNGCRELPLPGD